MAESNGHVTNTVEGVIASVNERGLRVGEDWFNVSKFRPLELPRAGTRVRITVDLKGFLSTITVLEQPAATDKLSRNETITRLSVLKSAAAFAAGRSDIKSGDVLLIADRWLDWVDQATTTEEAF